MKDPRLGVVVFFTMLFVELMIMVILKVLNVQNVCVLHVHVVFQFSFHLQIDAMHR